MAGMVEAELAEVVIDWEADQQQVFVYEKHGPRALSILVGTPEAMALRRFIDGFHPERPLTHELLDSVIRGLGGRVTRVDITDLRDATFHARLVVEDLDGKAIALEARPSDSFVLAVRANAPIFVDEDVLAEAGFIPQE